MLVKAGGRGLTLGLQARGGLGGGGRGELKPVLRNQKQVKLAVVAMLEMSTGFQSQVAAVEMWWTVHLEGGPRRVNHAAVAMGERVFSFGEPPISISQFLSCPLFRWLLHRGQLQGRETDRCLRAEHFKLPLDGGSHLLSQMSNKYNITLSQVPKPEDEVERAEWPYQRLP